MQWLSQYADDVLTLAGIGMMVYAAFGWHRLAGLVAMGAALCLVGYGVARMGGR